MWLSRVKIADFRNLEAVELKPSRSVNLITGNNGAGKTSVLEAIFYCCTARSFKNTSDDSLRRRGADICRLEVEGEAAGVEAEVAIAWGAAEKKQVKVDGIRLSRLAELFEHFHAVSFVPEDSEIVLGPPTERRRLLDLYISQADRKYLSSLLEYQRVLAQRNALLKDFGFDEENGGQQAMLSLWDEQLAEVAVSIVRKRLEFISECGKLLAGLYRRIESGESEFAWSYETAIDLSGELRSSLLDKLRSARRRDLNIGTTSVGPHRDDISIGLNGTPMRAFASQGEAKSAALAIKFAIFEFLKAKLTEAPILLLDELSSQLDATRVSSLLAMLPDFGQVFLTTTRGAELRKGLSIQAEMRFEGGRLVVAE